jgi:hypothetical protein
MGQAYHTSGPPPPCDSTFREVANDLTSLANGDDGDEIIAGLKLQVTFAIIQIKNHRTFQYCVARVMCLAFKERGNPFERYSSHSDHQGLRGRDQIRD